MQDYRSRGRSELRTLIVELQSIHSRQELVQDEAKLQKQFLELTDTMISAQNFYKKHPEAELLELSDEDERLSFELRHELSRLCRIDGCRDLLEKIQEESLHKLSTSEK